MEGVFSDGPIRLSWDDVDDWTGLVAILLIATIPATWATLAIFNRVLDHRPLPRAPDTRAPRRWSEASALGAGIGAIPGGLLTLLFVVGLLVDASVDWGFFAGLILIGGIVVGGLAGGLWGAFGAR